jgi:hypothetical protein
LEPEGDPGMMEKKEIQANLEGENPALTQKKFDVIAPYLLASVYIKTRNLSIPPPDNAKDLALSIFADFVSDILLHKRKREKQFSDKLKEVIRKKGEEIEAEVDSVYGAIKKIGFVGPLEYKQEQWRKAALRFFLIHQKKFKFVKREYLEEANLYSFGTNQFQRNFKRKLLQKIISAECREIYSGKSLLSAFKLKRN